MAFLRLGRKDRTSRLASIEGDGGETAAPARIRTLVAYF
jgi:hypothetical protein